MSKPKFDPMKPVQRRDGDKAGIICVDRKAEGHSIVALHDHGPIEAVLTHTEDGRYISSAEIHPADLINRPSERILDVWVNVYSDEDLGIPPRKVSVWRTKDAADSAAAETRIGCIHVVHQYKVVEGL